MTTVLVDNGCVTFFFLFGGENPGEFLKKAWSLHVVARKKFFSHSGVKK
ncbi:Hypothetical protein CpMEX1_2072 [Corynebacterium pseudotuberculosis]|nr:Hypothetical protein CpMEX1_2072 [Corynebacterium pseudotuberculosis]